MRWLRKIVVLVLAGFGAYKVWELVSPKFERAQRAGTQAVDHVVPAVRDAGRQVASASSQAADAVIDVTLDAVESVGDAVDDAVHDRAPEPSEDRHEDRDVVVASSSADDT